METIIILLAIDFILYIIDTPRRCLSWIRIYTRTGHLVTFTREGAAYITRLYGKEYAYLTYEVIKEHENKLGLEKLVTLRRGGEVFTNILKTYTQNAYGN